jgi:hypothetical protein
MPPNSIKDPKVGPKVKQPKKKVETRSLTRITSKVRGCARTLK